MKRLLVPIFVIALPLMYSCTDFKEEAMVPFGVDTKAFSFSSVGETLSLTVSSGSKWDIQSKPQWISLGSISQLSTSPFEWAVNISAPVNEGYDRDGVIQIKTKSETANISVSQAGKKGKYVPVESVSLSATELSLSEGEYASLSYVITPSNASVKEVTWKSDSPEVATVNSSGRVDAVSEGTAMIMVTIEDLGVIASCRVKVKATYIDFQDAYFRNYMLEKFDLNNNGKISLSEAKKVTSIKVSTVDIKSLSGIEYLTNLSNLDISNDTGVITISADGDWYRCEKPSGQVISIDISQNLNLTSLDCSYNQIESLDISNNTQLESLRCDYNQLLSLDISNNNKLNILSCSFNHIQPLYLPTNTQIKALNCKWNQIQSIDVSKCSELTQLTCNWNQLEGLDVSKNIKLVQLNCGHNKLSSLDISKNKEIVSLNCEHNMIENLDISNNLVLSDFVCQENKLTSLNLKKNIRLRRITCGFNELTTLDLSANKDLESLHFGASKISDIDLSNNLKLTHLYFYSNNIKSIDISKNVELREINCQNNGMSNLDVTKNTKLTFLWCDMNDLTSLDVSKNLSLSSLQCNPMNNNSLKYLYMAEGQSITDWFSVPSYTQIIRR